MINMSNISYIWNAFKQLRFFNIRYLYIIVFYTSTISVSYTHLDVYKRQLYTDPTSQKRTFHNQYEPGFIVARDKSPLELLIENKELFDK